MVKSTLSVILAAIAVFLFVPMAQAAGKEITLVEKAKAQSVIYVAKSVMEPDLIYFSSLDRQEAEVNRRRLRESVKDLAHYLQKMSGARIEVLTSSPQPKDKRVPIFIGTLAAQRFPGVLPKAPARQGFRVVVSGKGVGLMGESDEATSYAIYEVLDRLGCRWYMPSEMGEVIPRRTTISLPVMDFADAPSTAHRDITHADDAFKRRNRLGGFPVRLDRNLESYISSEQRQRNPEWRAIVNGQPHSLRLRWSHPGVVEAIADQIIATLDRSYSPTIPFTPHDGVDFDESIDTAWDAGDWDPSLSRVSITDRYVRFCNLVAERVTKKYPDVLFSVTAYVHYSRPPIREKLHPNIVPVIAPITYCRAHAMTDTHICPSRPQVRAIIEGWSKVSRRLSYTPVLFHRVEMTVPYPMMHLMEAEMPILFANNMDYWQPQTMPNFESVLPGLWLSIRKVWDKDIDASRELNEFFTRFYGAAAAPMRRYWTIFDEAWVKEPEHAGSIFGYPRRFTPAVMEQARETLAQALDAASTPIEYRRVDMQQRAFRQFERLLQLQRDLNEGRLAGLDLRVTEWRGTQNSLGNEYTNEYAFLKTPNSVGNSADAYFQIYFQEPYLEGAHIAREFISLGGPIREWKYRAANKSDGHELGWHSTRMNDTDWQTTDVAEDTWYKLGLQEYYGTVWYRNYVSVPAAPGGKRLYLWVSRGEGIFRLFVNGEEVPYVNTKGEKQAETGSIFSSSLTFDITDALRPGSENTIVFAATRTDASEIGTGGLLGPVYLYREK